MKFVYSWFFIGTAIFIFSSSSYAASVFNFNIFDQLQGEWEKDFRENRIKKLSGWLAVQAPEVIVFQEAQANSESSIESNDAQWLASEYPYRKYVHEMTGKDQFSYGYWMAAKKKPVKEFSDGFSFPGGVARKTQAAVWENLYKGTECLGVMSLHLSYQNTDVRQKEAQWIIDWVKAHETDCKHWIVTGDFNADVEDKEISLLIGAGFKSLVNVKKPTIGAFNPIRQIYGKDIPSRTIDWAFAWNVDGDGEVLFDQALEGTWLSDHAAVFAHVSDAKVLKNNKKEKK